MANELREHLDAYVENMRIRKLSENTVAHRRRLGGQFLDWCEDRDLDAPVQLTPKVIESYQRFVHRKRKLDGQPYSVRSQLLRLDAVRALCRFLLRCDVILRDPTERMEMPKKPNALPKAVLGLEEIEKVMAIPTLNTPTGLRDRAILEVFWATGIRRQELLDLDLYCIDGHQKTLAVHKGKGNRARVVPIGRRAVDWVTRYLDEARPLLLRDPDEQTLFITQRGKAMNRETVSAYVANYIRKANLGKLGSCHLIRHSVGTMLMHNGLNLRHVQKLLGHQKLQTTEIYTHLTIMDLKAAYQKAHPSAKGEKE